MKYYCKNCGTMVVVDINGDYGKHGMACPFNYSHGEMEPLPDYETPAQYKERTGKPYPDDGLVFYRHVFDCVGSGDWFTDTYAHAVGWCIDEGIDEIVVADPPFPLPRGWRPEHD